MGIKKRFLTTSLALTASLALTTGALAETADTHDQTAKFQINGGDLLLDIGAVDTFGTVKLDQVQQTVKTDFLEKFNIIDARGTGEGYRLDVSATQFVEVEPSGGWIDEAAGQNIIPKGSLSLAPFETIERVGDANGVENPTNLNHNASEIIDDGAVSVAGAAVGTGMGEFDLTFPTDALSLVVDVTTAKIDTINYPGDENPTPYEATITWDLVSAP